MTPSKNRRNLTGRRRAMERGPGRDEQGRRVAPNRERASPSEFRHSLHNMYYQTARYRRPLMSCFRPIEMSCSRASSRGEPHAEFRADRALTPAMNAGLRLWPRGCALVETLVRRPPLLVEQAAQHPSGFLVHLKPLSGEVGRGFIPRFPCRLSDSTAGSYHAFVSFDEIADHVEGCR